MEVTTDKPAFYTLGNNTYVFPMTWLSNSGCLINDPKPTSTDYSIGIESTYTSGRNKRTAEKWKRQKNNYPMLQSQPRYVAATWHVLEVVKTPVTVLLAVPFIHAQGRFCAIYGKNVYRWLGFFDLSVGSDFFISFLGNTNSMYLEGKQRSSDLENLQIQRTYALSFWCPRGLLFHII